MAEIPRRAPAASRRRAVGVNPPSLETSISHRQEGPPPLGGPFLLVIVKPLEVLVSGARKHEFRNPKQTNTKLKIQMLKTSLARTLTVNQNNRSTKREF